VTHRDLELPNAPERPFEFVTAVTERHGRRIRHVIPTRGHLVAQEL
jgi:hypothetical protein